MVRRLTKYENPVSLRDELDVLALRDKSDAFHGLTREDRARLEALLVKMGWPLECPTCGIDTVLGGWDVEAEQCRECWKGALRRQPPPSGRRH